jgi:hypothetical protein
MVLSSAPRIDRIDLHRIVDTVDVLDAYDRGESIKELLWMLDS